MAYRLRRKDPSVAKGFRRIAGEQIDKGIAWIDRADELSDAVHNVRVTCKKVRGLIRIVKPVFAAYSEVNADFRDIAQRLSGLRDAKVMQDTYDNLLEHENEHLDHRALGQVRRHFTLKGKAELDKANVTLLLEECRARFIAVRDRVSQWKIDYDGWDAIAPGISGTYVHARAAANDAREQPGAGSYHALRKQLKYHWFHTLLLRRIWSNEMDVRAAELNRVCDLLGERHDLALFTEQITDDIEHFSTTHGVELALVLSHRRRVMLEGQIWPLVDDLLIEKPDALIEHWHGLWTSWRKRK